MENGSAALFVMSGMIAHSVTDGAHGQLEYMHGAQAAVSAAETTAYIAENYESLPGAAKDVWDGYSADIDEAAAEGDTLKAEKLRSKRYMVVGPMIFGPGPMVSRFGPDNTRPFKFNIVDGTKVWESPAGLRYGPAPDPSIGNRIKHVLLHYSDDLDKKKQGVFSLPKNEVFRMIDDAWQKVAWGSAGVTSKPSVTMKSGVTRQVHVVEMNKEIGWLGGTLGAQAGNPSVTKLQIVVDNGRDLVSPFPVQ